MMHVSRLAHRVVRNFRCMSSGLECSRQAQKFNVNANVMSHPVLSIFAQPFTKHTLITKAKDDEENKSSIKTPILPLYLGAPVVTSSIGPTATWWLSECISVGGIKMGLPGLAAQVLFLAPMQAAQQIMKDKDTGKLPLLPYSAMAANGILWTAYGLLVDQSAIWAANVPGIALGLFYTGLFYMNCPSSANWLPGTKSMHIAGLTAHTAGVLGLTFMAEPATAASILGFYGCGVVVVMFSGPLAAMKQVVEEKSTRSLPFAFTIATFVNCALWTSFGWFVIDDIYVWGPNGLGFLSGCLQLGLFAKYGFATSDEEK